MKLSFYGFSPTLGRTETHAFTVPDDFVPTELREFTGKDGEELLQTVYKVTPAIITGEYVEGEVNETT